MLVLVCTGEASAARRKKAKRQTLPPASISVDSGFAESLRKGDRSDQEEGMDELDDDEDDVEPEDEQNRMKHYVPKDGRQGLVATAGFIALLRSTAMGAKDGTPPYYEGTLSPGATFGLALFPWRFKDGGGAARDLGLNVRFSFAPMRATVADAPAQPIRTDVFYALHAGIALRHVFGEREGAIAFGAELGVAVDAMTLAPDLLLPAAAYVSPSATFLLEIPLAKKHLVWATRAGVLPVTAVSGAQVAAYGARRYALGIDMTTGLRSTFAKDILYIEALALLTHYWHAYSGTGTQGFSDVSGRDLIFGVTASAGITY
ncbi:MAG: hypothetical protein IT381_33180 [Deltaproteobacteria bacterium]|nr:hypothetical protein [Deltaproteobacteria bacterium]